MSTNIYLNDPDMCLNRTTGYHSMFVGIHTDEPLFYTKETIDGSLEYEFNFNLVKVFDRVVIENDITLASKLQQDLFVQYFNEADTSWSNELVKAFDEYLGSYTGEIDTSTYCLTCL